MFDTGGQQRRRSVPPMRRSLPFALLCALALLVLVPVAAGAATTAAPQFPFDGKITASPGISPPGANNWSCKPPAAHPQPVVLVHGTFADMTSFAALSPAIRLNGYCVFALDLPKRATGSIAAAAAVLAEFVDRVLAATGAPKVDIVGHSQGGMLPRYYVKKLGGLTKVDDLVGLSPSNHGTIVASLVDKLVLPFCQACSEQAYNSTFLKALNQAPEAPAPVDYTNITTAWDLVVVPYTSGHLSGGSNVTNVTLQKRCLFNTTGHVKMVADKVATQWVLNALGRSGPADPDFRPRC
jgi:triacylglycerol lipase